MELTEKIAIGRMARLCFRSSVKALALSLSLLISRPFFDVFAHTTSASQIPTRNSMRSFFRFHYTHNNDTILELKTILFCDL